MFLCNALNYFCSLATEPPLASARAFASTACTALIALRALGEQLQCNFLGYASVYIFTVPCCFSVSTLCCNDSSLLSTWKHYHYYRRNRLMWMFTVYSASMNPINFMERKKFSRENYQSAKVKSLYHNFQPLHGRTASLIECPPVELNFNYGHICQFLKPFQELKLLIVLCVHYCVQEA